MREHLGHFYDKTSDFQQTQFASLQRLTGASMSESERRAVRTLVDIGCGTGSRTRQCFDWFPNLESVLAIDPDIDMIDAARAQNADPRITYDIAAAGDLARVAAGKVFDIALSNWALHWVQDKDKLFDGLKTVTHANSWLLFSTCEALPEILQFIDDYIRREFQIIAEPSPFHYLTLPAWLDFLGRHGWKATGSEASLLLHEVEDARAYLAHWFTASATKFMYGRHLTQLSALTHDELTLMLKRIYPSHENADGLCFIEKTMFVAARRGA